MASKRYSPGDQQKRIRDRLANLRANGVDAHEIHPVHPGGVDEALKILESDLGSTRDQSQEQIETGRARIVAQRKAEKE